METPSTLNASMPLRAVKSWSALSDGHGCAAEPLLPSTMTRFRSRPRRWMFGVVMRTPARSVPFSW